MGPRSSAGRVARWRRFRDLPVRARVLLLPLAAGLGLVATLAVLVGIGSRHYALLTRLERRLHPALESARDLEALLGVIHRSLQDAVAADEPAQLESADALGATFRGRLAAARSDGLFPPSDLDRLAREFDSYYGIARGTAEQMIEGAPSDRLLPALERMQRAHRTLRDRLRQRTVAAEAAVADAFDEARASRALVTGVIAAMGTCGIGLLLLVSLAVSRSVTGPLAEAVAVADRLAAGDLHVPVAPGGADELGRLMRAMRRMSENLSRLVVELRESEERFRVAAQNVSDIVYDWDIVGGRLEWLGDIDGRLGYPPGGFPRTLQGWVEALHPEDRSRVMAELHAHLEQGAPFRTHYRTVGRDGRVLYWREHGTALRDAEGRPYRMIGAMSDVTAQREAEAALRRSEEQLRQAQKMEAVGRLAGGVAHDFNNLLTAMLGHADLVLAELPAGHPVRTDVEEIQRAGQRAASLTRQLLAFSRKQLLQPKVIDLNRTVGELQHMLCRLIPENIEVRLDLMPTPIHVCADPGQIQQVLLNLVVNARDAMEAGGILGIASGLAELTPELAPLYDVDDPGEYAYLAVSDTGKGMDEATRRRIFEPFFTTKPQGQGTGLGLATVYGIVRQSNGYIWVHSEPGGGSVFVVFLPRVAAPAASCGEPERRPERRGTEVVLLVEDEASVRLLAARLLRRAGYTVLEAADGAEALELVLSDPGPIDLVLTDVVMPRLGGPDLVDRLLAERPGLKVLFMSGYSERELRTDAIPASKVRLLLKPFTPDALVATVRGVLDA